jgi:hypothetical protein
VTEPIGPAPSSPSWAPAGRGRTPCCRTLCYGLPASVDPEVRDGLVIVANVSRGVIDELDVRYGRLVVVHVTVPEEVRCSVAAHHSKRRPSPGDHPG